MLPTVVVRQAEIDLDKRTPFGPLGLAHQVQGGLLRGAVGFLRVAADARTDNVLPRGRPPAVARDDVIQIQILALEDPAAVLAGVAVALENVVPGELDFLLGKAVEHHEQDHPRHPDFKGDGGNGFPMRFQRGKIPPLVETEGLEGALLVAQDDVGMALEQEREGAPGRADIDRLPKAVQHQHVLI